MVITVVAQLLRHPGKEFVPPKPAPGSGVKPAARRNTENFTTAEMVRTPMFYLLYAMFVLIATGGLVVTANAGPLVKDWGLAAAALAAATTLSPIANGASRVSWGWISDRLGREITMAVAFAIQSACLVAVLTVGKTSPFMAAVAAVGALILRAAPLPKKAEAAGRVAARVGAR